jgi:uncharacterized membrane protein YhiD involved in acid resistance
VVAGIGLAVGCGFINAAIYTTLLVLVALVFLRFMEGILLSEEERKEEVKHGL